MSRKIEPQAPDRTSATAEDKAERAAVSKRHPMCGALKGLIRIAPGVDLTKPADPYWGSMTVAELRRSVSKARPPADLEPALAALWWEAKGKWERAHTLVMDESGKDCAWVHAYLHRVEGDLTNARYWYGQAGKTPATGPLPAEWDSIASLLLAAAPSE